MPTTFADVATARDAILLDLARRWNGGNTTEVSMPKDTSRFYKPQINYFCGSGTMPCPICKTGALHYSRSSYNGHVMATCSTKDCVMWRE